MERDPRPVNEMLRADILADRRAAEEAGADGEARREIGAEAGRPLAAGRVDDHPVGLHARREIEDGLWIVAVNGRGMPGAGKPQHRPRHLNRLLPRARDEHREHWDKASLSTSGSSIPMNSIGVISTLIFAAHLETGLIGNPRRIAADRFDVEAAFVEQISANRLDFFGRADMTSSALQLALELASPDPR